MPESSLSLPPLAQRIRNIVPSGIRRFFDIVAQMEDVISLGVGEPDFVTPLAVRDAIANSLAEGHIGYTSNYGLLELRQQIALHLKKLYSVEYNPDNEILITVGVSEAMDLAMRVLLDPEDEVLVPEPCYVSYKPCVSLSGGIPVTVETRAENDFRVLSTDLEKAITPRTKAIILGYPSNPTGATMDKQTLQEIVDLAVRRNLYIISDEIYDRLTYEGNHTCIASLPGAWNRTILLNGFSKSYAMTGWRIGYTCAPREIITAMVKVHAYTILCASTISQKAALEALLHAEESVDKMLAEYDKRRHFIVKGLNELGLHCHMPKGAFYAFPSIASTGMTAEAFTEKLLFEERLAIVPGTAFGASGENYIRCSYAVNIQKLDEALRRLQSFMKKIVG